MMTADHIIPKSNHAGLLTAILNWDNISYEAWDAFSSINANTIRTMKVDNIQVVISARDSYMSAINIGYDCRNLQPMCPTCNTQRGAGRPKPYSIGGYTSPVF